jgi:hypothetical protein
MQKLYKRIIACYLFIITKIPTLNPSHRISLIWDISIIVFNIIALFIFSVILMFGYINDKELNNTYMVCVNVSFTLTILKELITGYYN